MIHRLFRMKHDSQHETIWLTIYADLMTNLMLVFLALFGLTIMGNDAIARAIQSMKLGDIPEIKEGDLKFEDVGPALREKFKGTQDIRVTEDIGAVRIEFGEDVLFESGKAVPKAASIEPIRVVAELLKTLPHTIVVEGHTDSIPVQKNGAYRDNEELSLARAMSIVSLLIRNGIPAGQMAAAAYGSYRPRATNTTAMGRGINRRVEIALFKDFSYGTGK